MSVSPTTIRISFEDSANCGGTNNSIQTGSAGAYIVSPPGGITLGCTILIRSEKNRTGYELAQATITGAGVAWSLSSDGTGGLCNMEDRSESHSVFLPEGTYPIQLTATTRDNLYHFGAFAEFTFTGYTFPPSRCGASPSPTPSPSPYRIPFVCCGAQASLIGGYAGFTLPSKLHVTYSGIGIFYGAECYVYPSITNRSPAIELNWDGSGWSGAGTVYTVGYLLGVETPVSRNFLLRFSCTKIGLNNYQLGGYLLIDGYRFDVGLSGSELRCTPFTYNGGWCYPLNPAPVPSAACGCWRFTITE